MSEFYDFVLEDLDLRSKLILDAAVGAGEATYLWARRIYEQGGTSKIISIDNDLPQAWKEKIETRLGEYGKYVELKEADIFDLSFLEDESVDIVNCDDTIVFLNPKPLRLLLALKEFKRVLITDPDKGKFYKKFGFNEIYGIHIRDFTYGKGSTSDNTV